MKSHPNIEPSGFHRGHYVGYAAGRVYRIQRDARGWYALNQDGTSAGDYLQCKTLAAMSQALADVAKVLEASR